MNYCIVTNGMIENIIVCDSAETAAQFGALPGYFGAAIGTPYAPPPAPPEYTELQALAQDLTDEQLARIELGQQMTDLELAMLEGGESNV